jgi:hypothetical protein
LLHHPPHAPPACCTYLFFDERDGHAKALRPLLAPVDLLLHVHLAQPADGLGGAAALLFLLVTNRQAETRGAQPSLLCLGELRLLRLRGGRGGRLGAGCGRRGRGILYDGSRSNLLQGVPTE